MFVVASVGLGIAMVMVMIRAVLGLSLIHI